MNLTIKSKTVNYICVDLSARRFASMQTYLEKFHPGAFAVAYSQGLFLKEEQRSTPATIRISVADLFDMAGYYRNVHKGRRYLSGQRLDDLARAIEEANRRLPNLKSLDAQEVVFNCVEDK